MMVKRKKLTQVAGTNSPSSQLILPTADCRLLDVRDNPGVNHTAAMYTLCNVQIVHLEAAKKFVTWYPKQA